MQRKGGCWTETKKLLRLRIATAFLIVYFVWGSTYLAIRFAIDTLPPLLMAGIRFSVAGLLLLSWRLKRESVRPFAVDVGRSIVVGLLLIVGGNGMLVWCEQYIPSGLAALILAVIPIRLVLLDSLFVVRRQPPLPPVAHSRY